MKLHKLVFFAHGWHLGLTEEPLLDEVVQAWRYGPVVPSLYHEFKWFLADPIDGLAVRSSLRRTIAPTVDPEDDFVSRLLNKVWSSYGQFSAASLSAMTHEADSPWSVVKRQNRGARRVEIPNSLIAQYFQRKAQENREANGLQDEE